MTCRSVFNVWPETAFLFPLWHRDTKRLDTPVRVPVLLWTITSLGPGYIICKTKCMLRTPVQNKGIVFTEKWYFDLKSAAISLKSSLPTPPTPHLPTPTNNVPDSCKNLYLPFTVSGHFF